MKFSVTLTSQVGLLPFLHPVTTGFQEVIITFYELKPYFATWKMWKTYQAAEASAQSGEEVGDGSAVAVDPEGPQVPGRAWEGTGARLGVRA